METQNEYKMTYYVGAMLAQGGVLLLKEDRLVFAPGALERAVGSVDTVIPFDKIKMVEVTGTITEFLMVRTLEKAHRFVGSDLYKIKDRIDSALQVAAQQKSASSSRAADSSQMVASTEKDSASQIATAPQVVPSSASVKTKLPDQCPTCFKLVKADYIFCPFCQTRVKANCAKCNKPIESNWKFCAYCSSAVSS